MKQKKMKTKSDEIVERVLISIGVASSVAFLLGAFTGAAITNAI